MSSFRSLAAVGLLSASVAFSQTAPDGEKAPVAPTVNVSARLVTVPVTVRDKKGQLVATLKQEDFTLSEDGKPQTIRYFDRDMHTDLQTAVRICGGKRIPFLVFLSEDDQLLGLYGDRTLAKYRQMAVDQLGPACPSGIEPPHQSLLDATTQEWLNEFERIQLMLRLSSRLRQKHGD